MQIKLSSNTTFFSLSCLIISLYIASYSNIAKATVVEVRTNLGNFQVNLFDNNTPRTAENFLSYVNAGAFANNTVHRSSTNFVIQMGGFQYNNSFPPDPIATGTPVTNEPMFSNVRGTIAMAKIGGNPNSATSQFFVNLSNNAGNLDAQNGGFTVFGQVIGDGMAVVDQIAALERFNFGGAFTELPLSNYTSTDAANNTEPNENNIVVISDIVVVDASTITNPNLTPVRISSSGGDQPSGSSGSGGSIGIALLLMLALITRRKRLTRFF